MNSKFNKVITLLLCVVIALGIFPGYIQASGNPSVGSVVTAGDINGDGSTNNLDLITLFQYLSGWSVDVVVETLDVNGDDSTNNLDLVTLFQYLSGWSVEIFPQIICDHDGDTELRNQKEATCSVTGYTGDTYCLICNRKISSGEVIPTLPHTGGIATCHTKAICDVCGNPYGDFDPSNHSGDTQIRNAVAPGCITAGYNGDLYCLGCGEKISEGAVIPAIGYHGDTEIRNRVEATCTKAGYTGDTYCTVCNQLLYGGTEIPATGHLNIEQRGRIEPTCTADGFSGDEYCLDCGEFLRTGHILPTTGHTGGNATYYSKAVCTVCGEEYGDFADILAYDQLNENQKGIYTAIDAAVSQLNLDWFSVPFVSGVTRAIMESDIRVALHAVAYDKPEYFWMPKYFAYNITTDHYTGVVLSSQISFCSGAEDTQRGYYNVTPEEKAQMQAELDLEINKVMSAVQNLQTDFEKEVYIHDYLCEHITYDYATALASSGYTPPYGDALVTNGRKAIDYATINPDGTMYYRKSPWAYTIYGALVDGTCVCEGYSRAMQYFCHRLGIPCGLICGTGNGGPHMWNIINPGDGPYYLDVTFDDSIEGSGVNLSGIHYYFNITKEQLTKDHTIDDLLTEGVDYSDPNVDFNFYKMHDAKTEYYYYKKAGAYIYKNDATDAAQFAIDHIDDEHNMIEIEYENGLTVDDALSLLANKLVGKLKVVGSGSLHFGNFLIVVLQKQ